MSAASTMALNHLSFPSRDVVATAAFFERQLGCTVTAFGRSRLAKRPGFDIVIEDASDRTVDWPANFHVGFELDSVDALRDAYRRFVADGITMTSEVFHHPRGSRFFCEAPGGLLFEINTRSDADVEYRATFDSQRV